MRGVGAVFAAVLAALFGALPARALPIEAGVAFAWVRHKYTPVYEEQKSLPELGASLALPEVAPAVVPRVSAHLGYGWMQPVQMDTVRIEERDLLLALDAGASYRGLVRAALGGGVVRRRISVRTAANGVKDVDLISGTEQVPLAYLEVAARLAMPASAWPLAFSPFYRVLYAPKDTRLVGAYGLAVDAAVN